jgi:hypothetical protein
MKRTIYHHISRTVGQWLRIKQLSVFETNKLEFSTRQSLADVYTLSNLCKSLVLGMDIHVCSTHLGDAWTLRPSGNVQAMERCGKKVANIKY